MVIFLANFYNFQYLKSVEHFFVKIYWQIKFLIIKLNYEGKIRWIIYENNRSKGQR